MILFKATGSTAGVSLAPVAQSVTTWSKQDLSALAQAGRVQSKWGSLCLSSQPSSYAFNGGGEGEAVS